ncbi:hypothetical protein RQP46_007790 [Phenoliferia psychrophenolica]
MIYTPGSQVFVTRCSGGWNDNGGQERDSHSFFWNGEVVRNSGFGGDDAGNTPFTRCVNSLSALPGPNNPMVLVTWIESVADIEAPLASNAISNPAGTCEGFAIDQGDGNYNGNTAAAFTTGSNCTVTTTVTTGQSSGSASSYTPFEFSTVCNGLVYWNGAGYRQARYGSSGTAGDSITAVLSTSRSTIAYLILE